MQLAAADTRWALHVKASLRKSGRARECNKEPLDFVKIATNASAVHKKLEARPCKTKWCNCSTDDISIYKKMAAYAQGTRKERKSFLKLSRKDTDDMCNQCYCLVYGIPKSTFYRQRRDKKANAHSDADHRNKNLQKPQPSTLLAHAWLEKYAAFFGDYMPDFDEVHLPDYSWREVYLRMKREMAMADMDVVSETTFNVLRKHDDLGTIKIRKNKRFAKCDICVKIDSFIAKSSGENKTFWRNQKFTHNNWQMRERRVQANQILKCTNERTKHKGMVIGIDAMDNSKSALGQMPNAPKSLDKCEVLKTHITGVYMPSNKACPFICYTWHDRFPSGSDTVITMIMRALTEVEGPLPPKLYLHMDNCWRENKNKYMIAAAHLLVEMGVFKKVKISFLPVGHTHNIVDQMFSRFSIAIKKHKIFTIDDLHRVCLNSFHAAACLCGRMSKHEAKIARRRNKKKENVTGSHTSSSSSEKPAVCDCEKVRIRFEHLDSMACWGPLLLPHLPKITGISKPRYFRIERDAEGVVRHQYRLQLQKSKGTMYADNQQEGCDRNAVVDADGRDNLNEVLEIDPDLRWMPHNNAGYAMFEHGDMPDINNLVCVPLKPVNVDDLKELAHVLSSLMSEEERSWWDRRIKSFEEEDARCVLYTYKPTKTNKSCLYTYKTPKTKNSVHTHTKHPKRKRRFIHI
jgi:hypothetical protein